MKRTSLVLAAPSSTHRNIQLIVNTTPQILSPIVIVIVICLPTEHQGVHKNSVRNARAFQDRIGIWKCWFLRKGENRSTQRKTSRSRVENQQQTQPTYDAGPGNRTQYSSKTNTSSLCPKVKFTCRVIMACYSHAG